MPSEQIMALRVDTFWIARLVNEVVRAAEQGLLSEQSAHECLMQAIEEDIGGHIWIE